MLIDDRYELSNEAFAELTVWQLPGPLMGSAHRFKYSLALVVKGQCRVRYNNEQGKGDHRHHRDKESRYRFTTLEQLQVDFWIDVNQEFPE